MAGYTAVGSQTVNPGETVIFTETPVPCRSGNILHRDGTGSFLVKGKSNRRHCPCQGVPTVNYLVDFGANISIPTGGTVGAISVAITIDGATIPASNMEVTPAAVEEAFNVSRAINANIFAGCCESIAVRNTSSQPIIVTNASLDINKAK